MKKLFKLFVGVIGLIILGVIIAAVTNGGSPTEKLQQTTITKVNYDKIKMGDELTGAGGMTIEQVESILGKPDSKIESVTNNIKMEDYTWLKLPDTKSITVTFINGHVSNKAWLE